MVAFFESIKMYIEGKVTTYVDKTASMSMPTLFESRYIERKVQHW